MRLKGKAAKHNSPQSIILKQKAGNLSDISFAQPQPASYGRNTLSLSQPQWAEYLVKNGNKRY